MLVAHLAPGYFAEVLREVLGYSRERIRELVEKGVIKK